MEADTNMHNEHAFENEIQHDIENTTRDETNDEQGVNIRFFGTDSGDSPKIELLEPLGRDTPIGKFLDKRGPGIQQLAFEVDDLKATIAHLIDAEICMIHETPVDGAHGTPTIPA